MNRYVYLGLRNLFYIPVWVFDVARRNYKKESFSIDSNYRMVRKAVKRLIRTGNISLEISGKELLPAESGYAIYMNHQGYFDTLALVGAMEEPFVALAMEELDSFPFVKYITRLLRTVYMDRDDLRQSIRAIRSCANLLKQKENVLIFPEGALETEENVLLPYKAGAFKAAVTAGVPIVPAVLKDSFLPFDRRGYGKVNVYLTFLPPIYPEDYRGMRTNQIVERVQNAACRTLQKMISIP